MGELDRLVLHALTSFYPDARLVLATNVTSRLQADLKRFQYSTCFLVSRTRVIWELGQSGVHQYLPYYWLEPGRRFHYLIKTVDSVAGVALILKTNSFEMAEFYVTPQFRRLRIGRSAVEQLLQMLPGEWTISIAQCNHAGRALWSEALRSRVSEMPVAPGNCLVVQIST